LYLLQTKHKQEKEAEETIARLEELFPDDYVVYAWKGNSLSTSDVKKAEEYFQKSVEMAPLSSFAFLQYGKFLSEHERYEDAERVLGKAHSLQPVHPSVYVQLAYVLEQLDKNRDAEKEYRRYIKIAPKDQTGYLYYSNFLRQQGRFAEAEKVIKNGFRKSRNTADVHLALGALLHSQEKFDEAEKEYLLSIEINPDIAGTYFNLGLLYVNQSRVHEAVAMYRKAIEKDSRWIKAYGNLAWLLHTKLKQYTEAEEIYQKIITLDPLHPQSYHGLGILLRELNRNEEAISALQKAFENDNKDFIALMSIASIKRTLGMDNEARELAEKSRSLIPEGEDYWYNRACIEAIAGNNDMAFENLVKATEEKRFDQEWAWEDPDLQWLRDDPRFAEIVGKKPEK
jgi:tetratricopeptide (TPR) repeat protein